MIGLFMCTHLLDSFTENEITSTFFFFLGNIKMYDNHVQ